MKLHLPILAASLALAALAGHAQIERLSLDSMVQKTDDTLFAEITNKQVIRIDDAKDGPELFYTHLTLEGTSLETGQPETVTVTFPGGFVSEEDGVWNSEAPSDDDIKIGNHIVAFYKHLDNAGGGLACNFLYASHGGLFRTVEGPNGTIVMGRGEGYAIDKNISLQDLGKAVTALVQKEEL